MEFSISGILKRNVERKFSRRVEAKSEQLAKEKIYSFFGNVYRLPRRKIIIKDVVKFE